jgi:hypothetical protein
MHQIIIDGKVYRLEFRHKTVAGHPPEFHPKLHPKGSVRAITTCVLVGDDFIAIENAVCSMDDCFSRKEGRRVAFQKLLKTVGRLQGTPKTEITFQPALKHLWAGPPKPKAPRPKPTAAELVERQRRAAVYRAGAGTPEEVRFLRAQRMQRRFARQNNRGMRDLRAQSA